MKKIALAFMLAVPFITNAQTNNPHPPTASDKPVDSITYYQREIGKLWRQVNDSLKKSADYIKLNEQLANCRMRSEDYTGTVLLAEVMHSDYDNLNESIAPDGFSPLPSTTVRFGFGISTKTKRLLFDWYFGIVGINSRTKKGDDKISASLSNFFQVDLGIDLLKSKVVSLYPYAGLGIRLSTLKYNTAVQTNPAYTNITEITTNNRTVNINSTRLGYQAGLGFDVTIFNHPNHLNKTILFIKAGTSGPLWADRYKTHDIKYKPGIHQGDLLASIGLKFVGRE